MEATECSQNDAETALYDNNNDVQAAVNFLIDRKDMKLPATNWKEQKGRKTKKVFLHLLEPFRLMCRR